MQDYTKMVNLLMSIPYRLRDFHQLSALKFERNFECHYISVSSSAGQCEKIDEFFELNL